MENSINVLGFDKCPFDFSTIHETLHFSKERAARHLNILTLLGTGKHIYSFVVDKGHWNGAEIHSVFSNGVIVIRNQRTNLLITELVARPGQIRRYWEEQCKAMPVEIWALMEKARQNQIKGYNYL